MEFLNIHMYAYGKRGWKEIYENVKSDYLGL